MDDERRVHGGQQQRRRDGCPTSSSPSSAGDDGDEDGTGRRQRGVRLSDDQPQLTHAILGRHAVQEDTGQPHQAPHERLHGLVSGKFIIIIFLPSGV